MSFIDPQEILSATNGGLEIILSLYPDAQQSEHLPNRKFKTREEKTASAKLNKLPDGTYVVVDFGKDQVSRNAIMCYMQEQSCSYADALKELAGKYNIGEAKAIVNEKQKAIYSDRPATEKDEENSWSFDIRGSFNDEEIETVFSKNVLKHVKWKSEKEDTHKAAYARISGLFKEYRWHPLVSYSIVKNRKVMTFTSSVDFPIFLIDEGSHRKIYSPKHQDKGMRFMYEPGKKPKNFIHGFDQMETTYKENKKAVDNENNDLSENNDRLDIEGEPAENKEVKFEAVFYCTGGSDALNVALLYSAKSVRVLWPNSETEKLLGYRYGQIAKLTKKFLNLPDIDSTGKREAHNMAMEYLDMYTIALPEELKQFRDSRRNPCKDIRDYFNHYTEYDFNKLVDTAMPYRFWDMVPKFDRSGEFKGNTYELKNSRVYNFLQNNGFYKYMVGDKKKDWEFIQIKDNVVRFIDGDQVRDFVKFFLRDRQMEENLRDAVFNTTRINDTSLANLDLTQLNFVDYDKLKQIYFFQNTAVLITPDEIVKQKPGQVECFVWDDDVIDHSINLLSESPYKITKLEHGGYDIEIIHNKCLFFNYLINASRTHWRKELEQGDKFRGLTPTEKIDYAKKYQFAIDGPNLNEEEIAEQKQHLINKIFVIGYLLHRYKDSSRTWMVYAMDGHTREDFLSHGGSGKSILFNVALKKILRNNYNINGRDISIDKNTHKYDGVSEYTRYLTIEDAHQYLNLDVFFNDITGDLEVNPKGKTPYTVKFAQSPKFALTTNFTGRNLGGSTLRRLLNTVFSDYYHTANPENDYIETRTPNTEFGINLIEHFDREQYNYFYNTQLFCLQFFLGVKEKLEPNMSNVSRRQLLATMGAGFYDWAKVYFSEESENLDKLVVREEAFHDHKYVTQAKHVTAQIFMEKLRAFCKLNGYMLNPVDMLGAAGNIIKKVPKKRYEPQTNTWFQIPGETITKEMLFVQTTDVPDSVKPGGQQEKDGAEPSFMPPFKKDDLELF